jgi:deoxyribose-phosphate aldolase
MTTERASHENSELLRRIDYTDVRKELTYSDLERVCYEASEAGVAAVVVPSILVGRAARALRGSAIGVSCFVGYPFGTQAASVKAIEAAEAVRRGATELEVVPHFGTIFSGDWVRAADELATLRRAAGESTLKLVLETSRLAPEQLETVLSLAIEHRFSMVSNSIGFRIVSTQTDHASSISPAGIQELSSRAKERLAIKAVATGLRARQAAALVAAGAVRVSLPASPGALRSFIEEAR